MKVKKIKFVFKLLGIYYYKYLLYNNYILFWLYNLDVYIYIY